MHAKKTNPKQMYKVSWLVKTLTVQAFHAIKMLLRTCVTPIRPLSKRQWRKWIWLAGCLMTLGVLVMVPYMEISGMEYYIFEEDFKFFWVHLESIWTVENDGNFKNFGNQSSFRRQPKIKPGC